ncbi:MAG: hypothetical protein A3G75_13910 [Verrucomicrobia bacterium RIFCSPLOWO2_12_FULL_64_8]|nr:MAG: hypothetical protein A3G75_13910 [Verrucomicrobia bacterium RIFCSPLOWO2_12_FULL_64_8]
MPAFRLLLLLVAGWVAADAGAATVGRDPWFTDFAAARAQATAGKKRILALFTGTDWCPPCQEFEAAVAHHPDFLRIFSPAFVFLKLDYPRNTPQPPVLRAQNEELRRRFHISAYPTLLVLAADGTFLLEVKKGARAADSTLDYYIQAVDDARRGRGLTSWRRVPVIYIVLGLVLVVIAWQAVSRWRAGA